MKISRLVLVLLFGSSGLVGWPGHRLHAASAYRLVAQGNAALASGQYDEALKRYEEASVEVPESPQLYFDKGTAYYHKGEYAKAKDAFKAAATKSRDTRLEARCKFNLGNVAFREAQRQRDSDLQKSLAACQKSIQFYQASLELAPENKETAENIEVVRLTVKAILDEIKKKEEAAKKKQQQQHAAQAKLKELIKRQQQALDQGRALASRTGQERAASDWQDPVRNLTQDQRKIHQDTSALAQKMAKTPASPKQPGALETARQHVEEAAGSQQSAIEELEKKAPGQAEPPQQRALESLQKALAALSKPQGQPQGKGGKQQPKKGTQQPQPDRDHSQPKAQDKPAPHPGQKQAANPARQLQRPNERVRDILDEERQNQRRRQRVRAGGYRPVDKDW